MVARQRLPIDFSLRVVLSTGAAPTEGCARIVDDRSVELVQKCPLLMKRATRRIALYGADHQLVDAGKAASGIAVLAFGIGRAQTIGPDGCGAIGMILPGQASECVIGIAGHHDAVRISLGQQAPECGVECSARFAISSSSFLLVSAASASRAAHAWV